MIFNWFISKTVREACAMRRHVRRLTGAQRDILSPQAMAGVAAAMKELDIALAGGQTDKIRLKMGELEAAANKWFKPYPNATCRENIEVLLVALAVAMAIRTFFVQPFKIPTGSMQPTLYGVTSEPDFSKIDYRQEDRSKIEAEIGGQGRVRDALQIPRGWERVREWFEGISYIHVVAQNDGELEAVIPPVKFLIFNIKQTLVIGGVPQTIWFPPDYGEVPLEYRAGLRPRTEFQSGQLFHKGDDVVKMRVHAGDHLFVDRFTYNFRKPARGDIVVFSTQGIENLPLNEQGSFYIKRLVGLGGETLSIKQDGVVLNVPRLGSVPVGHLVVNGQPLSASTPHFENLYAFGGTQPGQTWNYQDNQYYGHGMLEALSPGGDFQVASNHCFVMGDNTMNSSDSRYWGDFPQEKIIGKSFFVYWPITTRFGLDNE
jgi:signal peptidase I